MFLNILFVSEINKKITLIKAMEEIHRAVEGDSHFTVLKSGKTLLR